MTKHRDLAYGGALPESFLDALAEFISTHISANAAVVVLNATTVQIPAGTGNDQVCIAVNGRWRWITAGVNATHPGGAAGVYSLWAVAADNSFAVGPPEVDSTNYAFTIAITSGGVPAGTLTRLIGYVEWNGTAVTSARLINSSPASGGSSGGGGSPGDYIFTANASKTGALLCNGASYLRSAYPALFQALGGTSSPYGLPDGTHFQVPDFRGRVFLPAGQGAGLTNRIIGTSGGSERVTLAAAESGLVGHGHGSGGAIVGSTVANQTGTGFKTGTGSTGTGTTGAGSATGGNTTYESVDHAHWIDVGMVARFSTLAGAGSQSVFGDPYSSDTRLTSGATVPHFHYQNPMVVAGLSVPALSIPQLTIPQLTVPSLVVNATDPATPAVAAAAASASHENMQPWATGYVFIQT